MAIGVGGTAGIAVAGAGAVALNVVLGKTNASIEDSNVRSAGAVSLTATSTSVINATVAAIAVSLGGGGTAGIGASIGIAVAINSIGWKQDGTACAGRGAGVRRSGPASPRPER